MRKSLLIAAVIVLTLAVGTEAASAWIQQLVSSDDPPGIAIPVLVALDVALLLRFALTALGSVLSGSLQGKLDGLVTLISGIALVIFGFVSAIAAFTLLGLMLSLVLAVPFGTIVYMGMFGSFARGSASALLSLALLLKATAMVLFVVWNLHVLRSKSTVLLALTCLLMTGLISFLHGIVPGFLSSITDAVAAIVVACVSVVWGGTLAVFGLPGLIRAIRSVAPG